MAKAPRKPHKARTSTSREAAPAEVVQITARIPTALHERLRRHSFNTRLSLNALILEGLETVLKRAR